jgi:hypothetical protein
MKTIEYAPDGLLFSDAEVEAKAREFLLGPETSIKVGVATFVMATRVLVREDVVPYNSIRFLFRGEFLYPKDNGSLPRWPEGFCDTDDDFLERVLCPTLSRALPPV